MKAALADRSSKGRIWIAPYLRESDERVIGHWRSVADAADAIQFFHGTDTAAAELAEKRGEIRPLNPQEIAHRLEDEFDLPRDSVWLHPYNEFSRGRQQDPHIYLTQDLRTAESYARIGSEVWHDTLKATWYQMNPYAREYERGTPESDEAQKKREGFIDNYLKTNKMEPKILEVHVPLTDFEIPEHAKVDDLDEWLALATHHGKEPIGNWMVPGPIPWEWVGKKVKGPRKELPTGSPEFRESVRTYQDFLFQRYAENHGLTPDEYRRKAKQNLKKLLKGKRIFSRQPPDVALSILGDRFRNQFETGTSGGLFDPDRKRDLENRILGIPEGLSWSDAERPIYGFMEGTGEHETSSALQYGPVKFVLKPEVRKRATFTIGDSLDKNMGGLIPQVAPSPIEEPSLLSVGSYDVLGPKNMSQFFVDFVEAQIYGGVEPEDIERIEIDAEKDSTTTYEVLRKQAEKLGIPVTWSKWERLERREAANLGSPVHASGRCSGGRPLA